MAQIGLHKNADKFQVINGHHRLQVLKAPGHTRTKCVIWEVDDVQTRLYLATLNRLSGEDIPERRALLIDSLLESFELDDLADLLPESRDQLAELERLARIDLDQLVPKVSAEPEGSPKAILEFFLDQDAAREVNLALDVVAQRHPELRWRSQALVRLAGSYLSANGPRRSVSLAHEDEGGASIPDSPYSRSIVGKYSSVGLGCSTKEAPIERKDLRIDCGPCRLE